MIASSVRASSAIGYKLKRAFWRERATPISSTLDRVSRLDGPGLLTRPSQFGSDGRIPAAPEPIQSRSARDAVLYSACDSPSCAHALTRVVSRSTAASSKSSETGGLANCSRLRTKTVH